MAAGGGKITIWEERAALSAARSSEFAITRYIRDRSGTDRAGPGAGSVPDLIDVTLMMTEYNLPGVDDDALESTVPRNWRRREPAAPPPRTVRRRIDSVPTTSHLIPHRLIS